MLHDTIYDQNLEARQANYQSLSPISYLIRAATAYADKTAVIHGDERFTYAQFSERCHRLANALSQHGIGLGDTVAIMSPNTPTMLEAHYGVPMTGAVLNALNYRLDASTIAFILDHGEARILITDVEFSPVITQALSLMQREILVIDSVDTLATSGERVGSLTYEEFVNQVDADFHWQAPQNEWQAISLCYTSGTTGDPKGVVTHHRGAYLNAIGNAFTFGLNNSSVYLWTLPMFHCNGWTYTWGVTAAGGTHVCLRNVDPALVFSLIDEHKVTHMCGAPIVLTMLIHAPDESKKSFSQVVEVATGGAAPPSAVISSMEQLGFKVTHLYGLTETYGPATVCEFKAAWSDLDNDARCLQMARQGVRYATLENLMVADSVTMEPVPADGETMGELMLRGNTVMKGYLKNPAATEQAFAGGWFHTGDIAVMHPDSYVEIKDRSKDVIISGGENISSLEIEEALYKHPNVMEAAVVARPDDRWGETPCAFVTTKADVGDTVSEQDIIDWCRKNLASFKIPKTVVFGDLPKTSTGKIQKYVLREKAASL